VRDDFDTLDLTGESITRRRGDFWLQRVAFG
jgi:hypothetical protein